MSKPVESKVKKYGAGNVFWKSNGLHQMVLTVPLDRVVLDNKGAARTSEGINFIFAGGFNVLVSANKFYSNSNHHSAWASRFLLPECHFTEEMYNAIETNWDVNSLGEMPSLRGCDYSDHNFTNIFGGWPTHETFWFSQRPIQNEWSYGHPETAEFCNKFEIREWKSDTIQFKPKSKDDFNVSNIPF